MIDYINKLLNYQDKEAQMRQVTLFLKILLWVIID